MECVSQCFCGVGPGRLNVLARESGGQREGNLVGLLSVRDLERVKEPGASDLELGHTVGALLNLDGLGVLPPRLLDEIADIRDKLGHSSKLDL